MHTAAKRVFINERVTPKRAARARDANFYGPQEGLGYAVRQSLEMLSSEIWGRAVIRRFVLFEGKKDRYQRSYYTLDTMS